VVPRTVVKAGVWGRSAPAAELLRSAFFIRLIAVLKASGYILAIKIYLDMCSLQRPLDTKTQLRITVEAEAILGILALCESGQAELVASEALVFEAGRNPHPVRKRYAAEVLSKAKIVIHTDSRVAERARVLHEAGIQPLYDFAMNIVHV
jgi:hypothetical protein